MDIKALVDLAGLGAELILYLLIALSAIQLAITVERLIVFFRSRRRRGLERDLEQAVDTQDVPHLMAQLSSDSSLEGRVLASAAAGLVGGPKNSERMAEGRLADERGRLESGLSFLGTLGNNAPFIGLLGTVLGVIHAFADLSASGGEASASVMAGISEALVLTGVGLLVALPAVVAFNAFQRAIERRTQTANSLCARLIAQTSMRGAY